MRRRSGNMLDRLFVYHPEPWIDRDWRRASRLPLEDVWFTAEDGTELFGWYVAARGSSPVLLWCHGNAGNLIHRLDNLSRLVLLGLSVFVFDYRGYGLSKGKPTEEGLYQDARAAHRYVVETRGVEPRRLVVFGRSLGASVAGALTAQRPAAGLILESPFPSVAAVAREQLWGLPAHWLLQSRFRLIDRLKAVHVPVLVIHGEQDHMIPIKFGRQVFAAANPPKSFYAIPGADHNDTYLVGGAAYFARLKDFIDAAVHP